MRSAFLMAFILNIGLNLCSLMLLPETVAIHFSRGGRPDDWASKEMHVLLMILVDGLVFLPLYFAPRLFGRVPPRYLSLPYKQYWLRAENRRQVKSMLSQLMSEFGCALYGFLFGTALLALEANRSVPVRLDEPLFIIFLAIFLVYTIVWTIRLVVRLRPPGQT